MTDIDTTEVQEDTAPEEAESEKRTLGSLVRSAEIDTRMLGMLGALAVIAYRQPVSRGQVNEIRGVDSEQTIRTLERRDLVAEVGRAPGPGQAVLYGTTPTFLERMGLTSIGDLPPLADHVPPAQVMETLEMPMRPESSSNDSTS